MAKELYPEFDYFVTWPPPHHIGPPHAPITKEVANRVWYWNSTSRQWVTLGRNFGTPYRTRKEAERVALIASVTQSEYGAPIGEVKISRQRIHWLGKK